MVIEFQVNQSAEQVETLAFRCPVVLTVLEGEFPGSTGFGG
jgi:hypothetical protein